MPLLAPVTKRAWTEHEVGPGRRARSTRRSGWRRPRTGDRCSSTSRWRRSTARRRWTSPTPPLFAPAQPDAEDVAPIAALLAAARRPVLVLGSDVWLGGADVAARLCAETLRLPVITNGQARGVLPGGHSLLVTRARSLAFAEADLVIVVGVPLDFRLRYGSFGPKDAPASVVHVADSPGGIATHCPLAASASGDLSLFFTALTDACGAQPVGDMEWLAQLRGTARAAAAADVPLLESDGHADSPDAGLRRAAAPARRRRGRHRRRRRLRLVRGPPHRARLPRPLARPRPLRLPGHRPRLRDSGPAGAPVVPGRPDARRRRGRACR